MPNWFSVIDDELHGRKDDGLHAILIARHRQHHHYESPKDREGSGVPDP